MSSMVLKPMIVAVAIAFAGGAVVAFAAERSIMQKGKVFSESAITIKKGDVVVFVNDDSVTHNVMSTDSGNEFNIGSQPPGVSTPVTFDKAGEYTILCAIHPRMKLVVKVNN
jgi:plastocyanin